MQITRQADYAVRAVLHLARVGNSERSATSTVAKEQNIPPSFLAKIISQLSIAGLLHTSRGARGGVTLARDPEDISLLEVIESIDGPPMLNQGASEGDGWSFDEEGPLRPGWREAKSDRVARLQGTNCAQLLERSEVAV